MTDAATMDTPGTEIAPLGMTAAEIADNVPSSGAVVPVMIDPARAFMPVPVETLHQMAKMLAGMPGLAKEFDQPINCIAIAYQAARWGLDPVAVASKAYFANGRIGYEAQLIHALINKNAPLIGRLKISYGYADPQKRTAPFRFCRVSGALEGESLPSIYVSPTFAQIKVKNSPLWFSDLDQQLAYYSCRAWGRRYVPEVLLGIYAREEIESIRVIGEERPKRALFDDSPDPVDAEFSDAPHASDADVKQAEADLKKKGHVERQVATEQKQDDPTDDQSGSPSDGDLGEPEGMEEAREWLGGEQGRILAMTDGAAAGRAWKGVIADKRYGRLKAYSPGVASAAHKAVAAHIGAIKGRT